MSDVVKAFQKSSIKELIIIPRSSASNQTPICGKIAKFDASFIYVKISTVFHDDVREFCEKIRFDIKFKSNSTPFQVQHHALRWMDEHFLYSKLIKSPFFKNTKEALPHHEYIFKSKTSENLNAEQKTIIKRIMRMNSDSTPYLIFGPPGSLLSYHSDLMIFIHCFLFFF